MEGIVEKPHLPKGKVGLLALGERYGAQLAAPLYALGVQALWIPDARFSDGRLAGHADLRLLHLGGRRIVSACGTDIDNILTNKGFEVIPVPEPGEGYPRDCALNACIAGGRFFHRLDASSPEALANLPAGLETVNIAQGYAKCSVCVVDGRSVITADRGIAKAALSAGLDVLTVTPGYIELEGFDCGFIGGASFKLAPDVMAFTGTLDGHPDRDAIISFLAVRGIKPLFLTGRPAFDIGSALPLTAREPSIP